MLDGIFMLVISHLNLWRKKIHRLYLIWNFNFLKESYYLKFPFYLLLFSYITYVGFLFYFYFDIDSKYTYWSEINSFLSLTLTFFHRGASSLTSLQMSFNYHIEGFFWQYVFINYSLDKINSIFVFNVSNAHSSVV